MIEAHALTKRYGDKTAVDSIDFTVPPGSVTGFLGPNGAGKSTTMRMIVGLDRPSSGVVTVNGKPYAQHRSPACARSVPSWTPRRSTAAAAPARTCARWPPPTASRPGASTRSST